MQHRSTRLTRTSAPWGGQGAIWSWGFATLSLLLVACAEAPQNSDISGVERAAVAAEPVAQVEELRDEPLAGHLQELETRHGAAPVAAMLESLRALAPYFEDAQVDSGRAAAEHHWATLDADARTDFADCLGGILDQVAWIDAQTASLPDGYHTAAYALPESKALYAPLLERYGLDPRTATSADVASSLSSYDDASLRFAIAEGMCAMSEDDRADYLARFRAASGATLSEP